MSIRAEPFFPERLRGGPRRFQWAEPRAFRKLRWQAEWRRLRSPVLIALLAATPVLIFLGSWLRDRLAGEPFRWGMAVLATLGIPALLRLAVWLQTGPLSAHVQLTDKWISRANGKSFRRWEAQHGFWINRRPDFAILALLPRQGKPVFLGVPPDVPFDELAAFLRRRGLEQRFDDDARQPTLPAATA
jgi:hypothetical protein